MSKILKNSFKLYRNIIQLENLKDTEKIILSYYFFISNNHKFHTNLKIWEMASLLSMDDKTFSTGRKNLIENNYLNDNFQPTDKVTVNELEFYPLYYFNLSLKISYIDKFILSYILLSENNGNKCFSGNDTIASDLNVSLSSIEKRLVILYDNNILTYSNSGNAKIGYGYKRLLEINRDVLKHFINNKLVIPKKVKKVAKKEPIQSTEVIKEKENVPLKEKESLEQEFIRIEKERRAKLENINN